MDKSLALALLPALPFADATVVRDEYHQAGVAKSAPRKNRTNDKDEGSTSDTHILMTAC